MRNKNNTIVTEESLRELVNELLDDSTAGAVYASGPDAVKVNDVVDPSAANTDPMNPDFKPQDATELKVAIDRLATNISDEDASKIYDKINDAFKSQEKNQQKIKDNEETKMKDDSKSGTKSGTVSGTAESVVRSLIRKILSEEYEAYDSSVKGGKADEDDDDDVSVVVTPDDVASDDKSFDEIAQELGLAVTGAKQFVDKALARYNFLHGQESKGLKSKTSGGEEVTTFEPPDSDLEDIDVLLLKAWNDYIELLNTSGELTPADVQLMHDHPEVALELDGFREYVHSYIAKATMPVDKKGEPWLDVLPATRDGKKNVDPELKPFNPQKPNADRSGVRTFQNAPSYKGDFDWLEDDDKEDEYKQVKRKAAKRAIGSQDGSTEG